MAAHALFRIAYEGPVTPTYERSVNIRHTVDCDGTRKSDLHQGFEHVDITLRAAVLKHADPKDPRRFLLGPERVLGHQSSQSPKHFLCRARKKHYTSA